MQFDPDSLMEHVIYLAAGIGPRPPASAREKAAADYVRGVLADLGAAELDEQSFYTSSTAGSLTIPYLAAATAALPVAWTFGAVGRLLGGLTLISSAVGLRQGMRPRPPVYQDLVALERSQNVIARFPAAQEARQELVLLGHLDSQKSRRTFPRDQPELTKPVNTAGVALLGLTGIGLLLDGLSGEQRIRPWHLLVMGLAGYSLYEAARDEMEPHVPGANDNASAVAVLLEIGRALASDPLPHTAVTLLFTGAEEVGCTGIESYIEQHRPDPATTLFLDLEMVGTGQIAYVNRHGISHFSEYVPGPRMTAAAAQVARENPELGVTGREMVIVEEVGVLTAHGYDALCVAGHNAAGYLPNWHRATDTVENIEPDTLQRAAQYVWRLMHAGDEKWA
ncbi:MAG: M20/M25/M40 family metallo-hydrolase [Anaerolineae bacterium]